MKKSIFIMTLSTLCIGLTLTNCGSSPEKVENAKEDVVEAQHDLDKAKADYEEEYAKFKLESEQRISENDKNLADLKARSAEMKKDAKADYDKRVAELETRNENLKVKVRDYRDDEHDHDKWEAFKREFNHDMEELGNSFRDMSKNNVK